MTQPRRLLFVLQGLAFGGVERQAELLAAAAKRQGHQVALVVTGGSGPALTRFRPHCESIQVLDVPISNDFAVWTRLRRVAATVGDAAFMFNVAKFPVLSNALSRRVRRQVLHIGNPVGWGRSELWKQRVRSWLFPPSPQLRLAANSRHTLRSLNRHPFYGHFPARVSLNCVDIPERVVTIRERCAPIRVGMVARLDPIKDHATLIRAIGRLVRCGTPVHCELIGRGSTEESLRQLAEAEGLMSRGAVSFAGWTEDVGAALGRWDIFVFSTTAQEGFGNAAAEAMAHGLPCIFTDVGPCREVGAEAVEYVPQGDDRSLAESIAALASDAARRNELAGAARARAQSCFGAERKLSDFLSLAFDA